MALFADLPLLSLPIKNDGGKVPTEELPVGDHDSELVVCPFHRVEPSEMMWMYMELGLLNN